MFRWLADRFRRTPPPLEGGPALPRQKTYSAASGYVYQYFYQGHRPARRSGQAGEEYVFDVSADRKSSFPVSVFLFDRAAESWERRSGRPLLSKERYAVAKIALFQAFDERAGPPEMREEILVRPADLDGILESLGLD